MKELSLHILDLVRNSIRANASLIRIDIEENRAEDFITIEIEDNGEGMDREMLRRIEDPFFTTDNKKTGLGIPLLRQHAEAAGGNIQIHSEKNKGTIIKATFQYSHIDRQPMGNITDTIISIIRSEPERDIVYHHKKEERIEIIDTRKIKKELEDIKINDYQVVRFLKEMIDENLNAIKKKDTRKKIQGKR